MKIKYIVIYAAVAVAFAAVSLWVALSRGRNATAIRTKFRLGGILLTLSALISACGMIGGCNGPGPFVTCYDPVMPNPVSVNWPSNGENGNVLHAKDVLVVTVDVTEFKKFRFVVTNYDDKDQVIQDESFVLEENTNKASIAIADTDFKGAAVICIYGIDDEESHLIWDYTFTIE